MKRILCDLLRRTAGVYVVGALFIPCVLFSQTDSRYGAILFADPILIALPALMALQLWGGAARVVQILPVSRKTAATAYWLYAVPIPAMFVALFALIGNGIHLLQSESVLISFSQASLLVVYVFLWLGTMFFIFTTVPIKWPAMFAGKLQGAIGVIGWTCGVGGAVFFFQRLAGRDWSQVTRDQLPFAACGVLTTLGWLRSEQLLIAHATAKSGEPLRAESLPSVQPVGVSGVLYLLQKEFMRSVAWALLQIILFLIIFRNFSFRENASTFMPGTPFLAIMWVPLSMSRRWVSLRRFLRLLPLSNWNLTGILIALFLIPVMVSILLIAVALPLALGAPNSTSWIKLLLTVVGLTFPAAGAAEIGMPHTLQQLPTLLVGLLAVFASFWYERLDLGFASLIGVVGITIGILLFHQVVSKSSGFYRPQWS